MDPATIITSTSPESATIITSAITTISPYLIKGGKAIAEGIGKDLWGLIKKLFKSEKDKKIIEDFKENPGDEKLQGKMELKLEEFLEEDPELVEQIKKLLPEAKQQMPKVNVQNIKGNNNTALQDIHGSTINIEKN